MFVLENDRRVESIPADYFGDVFREDGTITIGGEEYPCLKAVDRETVEANRTPKKTSPKAQKERKKKTV